MIPNNHHTPTTTVNKDISSSEQGLYSLGPKTRLKGFHKSHYSPQLSTSSKPSIILPISSSSVLINYDPHDRGEGSSSSAHNITNTSSNTTHSLINNNLILGDCDGEDQPCSTLSNQSTMISSSFGTSFLLSNDLLNRVDGSNRSIYEVSNQSRYNPRNVEDFGKSKILFHRACKEGSLRKVIRMLDDDNGLINSRYENVTPLYACIEENSYEVFKELLDRKAVITEGFLEKVIERNGESCTKISCLYLAIHLGKYTIVEDLMRKANFMDINIGKVVKNRQSTKFKETPLFLAVRLGDIKMIKTLLSDTRFWPHFNLVNSMVSKNYGDSISNTIFQALFSIEGRTFLERERKSRDCFLEIKKMYNSIDPPIASIQEITSDIKPFSLLHFSRCSYSGTSLKTIHSPLYLAIMNENDYLTRELVSCVPNKHFGEFVSKSNETESCLYLAIYKRSIHVIIYLLRINADTLEDVDKLREFASGEGIHLDHYIKVARYFTNRMYNLAKGIVDHYSDLEIITQQ